jgi:putative membrane protein
MQAVATVLLLVVALIHVYIVVLEMVLWTAPQGRAAFGTTRDFAEQTKTLAANQGLYNGFLAAGLIVAAFATGDVGFWFGVFFTVCVAVAGVYGALTANRRILLVQTVPAVVALAAVLAAG